MRLVDREQGEPAAGEEVEEAQRLEPLGGHVDEVELALAHGPFDAHRLLETERRVEDGRAYPELDQGRHLVLHQRYERRDDDRRPSRHKAGTW